MKTPRRLWSRFVRVPLGEILLVVGLTILFVGLLLSRAEAQVTYPEPVPGVCREEGGCVWVSKDWLKERINEARNEGATSPACFHNARSRRGDSR